MSEHDIMIGIIILVFVSGFIELCISDEEREIYNQKKEEKKK